MRLRSRSVPDPAAPKAMIADVTRSLEAAKRPRRLGGIVLAADELVTGRVLRHGPANVFG